MKSSTSFITLVCVCILLSGYTQTSPLADSLYQAAQAAGKSDRCKLLYQSARAYQPVNPARAIEVAQEGILASADSTQRAEGEFIMGLSHYFQGNHDVALKWYLKSLASYKKLNDKPGQAAVLNDIGTLIKKQGDLQKSAGYFKEGLELAKAVGDSSQIANSMNNLGIALEMMGQKNEAMELYQTSADIKRRLHDFNGLSYNLDNMGMLLTTMQRYNEAEKSFNEAAAIRLKLGDRRGYGVVINNLGEMWLAQNNTEKALKNFHEALRIADETHYADFKNYLYGMLANVYKQQKNYEQSLYYFQQHIALKDSIFNEQKSKQLLEMQTKYDTEKKELQIQEQQLKLERNQAISIGLVIALLSLILLAIQWRKQMNLSEQKNLERQQRENQEKLTRTVINLQEKERSRFAKDLHDGFGQLITALKIQFEKTGQRSDGASELIQHMLDEIRNVSFALSPQVLVRDGLVQALKELSFRINRTASVTMTVQTTGLNNRLPEDYEITLYRVSQEWINNILKYSGASRIDVQLIEHSDEIILMLEDNGKGFAPSSLETGSGNGWKNIQSRIQILNGQVEIDSAPERAGTTFTASVPKSLEGQPA